MPESDPMWLARKILAFPVSQSDGMRAPVGRAFDLEKYPLII